MLPDIDFAWWALLVPAGTAILSASLSFFAALFGQRWTVRTTREAEQANRRRLAERDLLAQHQEAQLAVITAIVEMDAPERDTTRQQAATRYLDAGYRLTMLTTRCDASTMKATDRFIAAAQAKTLFVGTRFDFERLMNITESANLALPSEKEAQRLMFQYSAELFIHTGRRIQDLDAEMVG